MDNLIERHSGNVHKKKKRNQADQNRRDKRWDTSRFCKSCGDYKDDSGKCAICGTQEDYATAAGTARGAHKAWLTRQHGKDKAKRKRSTGLYSKPYHNWVLNNAADLQNDKAFRDKYSKNDKRGKPEWIAMSYIQSHHIARKKFA